MILFLADGQLGNQIFQYVFLKTIQKKNESIVVSGFEELSDVFEIDDIININKKNTLLRGLLFRFLKPILNYLSEKKIISSIAVDHEKVFESYKRESTTNTRLNGTIDSIVFVKQGYFQSKSFFDKKYAENLVIKKRFRNEANNFFDTIPEDSHRVFVHIRRGDYKNYKVFGKSTLVPISYYKEQINYFIKNKKNYFFIFLSDEPEFIEEEFKYIDKKLISHNAHFGTDFAIMTMSDSAILSPSSFGWWGSYLIKDRDVVFAPKYWTGFNSKVSHHANSVPSFAEEIEI